MNAMIQGHMQVESVKENRQNKRENIHMIQKKKPMMPRENEEIVHGQISTITLIST